MLYLIRFIKVLNIIIRYSSTIIIFYNFRKVINNFIDKYKIKNNIIRIKILTHKIYRNIKYSIQYQSIITISRLYKSYFKF